ncbi:MAG: outer membrane beta-barrel protein [Nitrospiraceae bacterium]
MFPTSVSRMSVFALAVPTICFSLSAEDVSAQVTIDPPSQSSSPWESTTTTTDHIDPPASTQPPQATPPRTRVAYVSLFGVGASPFNESLDTGSTRVRNAQLQHLYGGGIKVGAFPTQLKGYVGFEGELFGMGGSFQPRTFFEPVDASIVSVNMMANILLRYPGTYVQPYIGAGVGSSFGHLDANRISTGMASVQGSALSGGFAFQLIGGLRAHLTDRAYLFGEYKYFGAEYSWETKGGFTNSDTVDLSLRAHIIAAGVGFTF